MPSGLRDKRSRSRDAATSTPRDANMEGQKVKVKMTGPMDRWVEPTITPKASYEDHNGVPYGVLEHMQPLGEPPSARVRARAKGEGARKSVLGRSAASVGVDAQETPESTPQPPSEPQTCAETPVPPPVVVVDDDEDDDYAPHVKGKKKAARTVKPRASTKRQSDSGRASAEPSSSKAKPKPKPRTKNLNKNRIYNAKKLHAVVEEAKRRAVEAGKHDLAAAVNQIYLDSLTDKHLTELMEDILCQTASEEQTAEFHIYVKKAKKKLKSEKAEKERKLPESQANGTQPQPPMSPPKNTHSSIVPIEQPHSAAPSIKPATSSTTLATSSTKPSTTHSSLANPQTTHTPKLSLKVRSPTKSSDRRQSASTAPASSSPVKHEQDDMDALSDISELTELSEVDEPQVNTPIEPPAHQPGPSTTANSAQARVATTEPANSAAPKGTLKRTAAETEDAEDERQREIQAKKAKLSVNVVRDFVVQESSMRSTINAEANSGSKRAFIPALNANAGTRSPAYNGPPPRISIRAGGPGPSGIPTVRTSSSEYDSPLSTPRSTPPPGRIIAKPVGKRAKTKNSPTKKQKNTHDGLSGPGGAAVEGPIGSDDNEESINNDFCSACGTSGFLLCCDGCDRSFHFSCLDPPLSEDASELNEPWYCFICVAKRPVTAEQSGKPTTGLFASLLHGLTKRNPTEFCLPQDVREFFEGVGSDERGRFTEAVRPARKSRGGYVEKVDDLKLKDAKGHTVLCYHCGKSSGGVRPIITCDKCAQHWHLDCLDPPLANAPGRDAVGNKTQDWMCPLHINHDLRRVDTRLLNPARLGRKIHLRKPKNPKSVEASLRRGMRNNGIIDVLDDESETESEFYEEEDLQDESIVYKLPSSGIKLDFIAKVKQGERYYHAGENRNESDEFYVNSNKRPRIRYEGDKDYTDSNKRPRIEYNQMGQPEFADRSIKEQRDALLLAQLKGSNPDIGIGGDSVTVNSLVATLIAQAPSEIIDGNAAGDEGAAITRRDEAADTDTDDEVEVVEQSGEKANKKAAKSLMPPAAPSSLALSDQPGQLTAEQRDNLLKWQAHINRLLQRGTNLI